MYFKRLAAVAALGCVFAAAPSKADTAITNFTFDSVAIGATIPTSAPGTDPLPQGIVYSTGGFPDTGPYTGTNTVQNVGGLNHAVVMTTTQGGIGANFIDTQFINSQHYNTTSFDIDVLQTPDAALIPQGGQAFVIQAFNLASDRAWRFIVSPTDANGGTLGLRDNTVGNPIPFANYTTGTAVNVEILSDFNTGLVSVYLNGTFELTTPMVNAPTPASTGLEEFFMFQNGVEGQTNSIALDNFNSVSSDTPQAVPGASAAPLPSVAYAGIGLLAIVPLATRRRRALIV